jgi:RNA polymerase sigma-70 factor (ECF subfamily)
MRFRISGTGNRNKTDEELLLEYRSGRDLEVLGELYSRYIHLVYGVCLKYLREREESKDAVMQIFEKLISDIPVHDISNFRSWLYVVTKNFCLMQIRSQKSRFEKHLEWEKEEYLIMENDYILHPIDDGEKDMDIELEDCIGRLKDEQRECIRQFYFDNRCYNDIASNMNIDEKKVKSHLQNAKRNIKICLEEKNVRKSGQY